MIKLVIHNFDLKLNHPFTISRGTRSVIPNIIVELQYNGKSGFGEATENLYYNASIEKLKQSVEDNRSLIESINIDVKPKDFWETLKPYFKNNNFPLCAIDEAYHDLFTKNKGLKLYEYWDFNIDSIPLTSFTIGIDSIPKMIEKIKEKPWPVYKIKLGTKDDIAIIKALRKETQAVFRIDANASWTVEETLENAIEMKKLGVEFLEQPLPADNWEGAKEVYQKSVLPIIADESCEVEEDIDKCYGHFHGVNVKLMKCGGLTPAKRMLEKAKNLGLKTMAGCMTESSVGISAIAHLLPLLDYVDMDGALLLSNDPAKGVLIDGGNVSFSKKLGNGSYLI